LPHPLAGKYIEVFGALYGLGESNRLFHEAAHEVCLSAGFTPSKVGNMTYSKCDPNNKVIKCITSCVVDDFRSLDNDSSLSNSLRDALKKRFTNITYNEKSTTFSGIETKILSNGAIRQTQNRYIARTAENFGIAHLPLVDTPFHEDFFKELDDIENAAFDQEKLQKINGHLTQMLKTRDDVKHLVNYTSSKNCSPRLGYYTRAIHILRYIYSTPEIGRTFKSNSTEIFAHVDTSHANLPGAKSTVAFFLSVGKNNAPFHSVVKVIPDIPTCPMTAEYMGYSTTGQAITHFRQLSEELGFPVSEPTTIFNDNKSAIALSESPEISRKSKHIWVRYHYIRDLVKQKIVSLKHNGSKKLRATVMTKFLQRPQFKLERRAIEHLLAYTL